jgi:hypothetical protein
VKEERKAFFFEKKKQKTFITFVRCGRQPQSLGLGLVVKSFVDGAGLAGLSGFSLSP